MEAGESGAVAGVDGVALEKVRSGQRLIIFALLANFLFVGVRAQYPVPAFLVALAAAGVAIYGLLRLASGLKYGTGAKILLVLLQFIPLVNIIALIVLSTQATKALRAAGYKVGLLGAPRQAAT